MFEVVDDEKKPKTQPKQFETQKTSISSKLHGKVKVKQKAQSVSLEGDKIEIKKGEYIKLLGITSIDRTPLFYSNLKYVYLLELTNNLDFIATSILGGELDKMLLISEENNEQGKCQFLVKNNLIYIVYGVFPDKKGKWILEQMNKHFSGLIKGKNVDKLTKFDKHQIITKFEGMIRFIIEEYLQLQDVFSDQDIPYVEDKLRIDYLGLASRTIGVISLLLGDELNIEMQQEFDTPEELNEMKESLLTAKIEAIAANTLGNTGAMPRWIAVKLGFQNYRFLTFQKLKNDYFLSFLSEGNLEKLEIVENQLGSIISPVTEKSFTGDLRPFNQLKILFMEKFKKTREFS
jgi:hypothetical protein